MTDNKSTSRAHTCNWLGIGIIIASIVISILLRVFVLGVYVVPTSSMVNTIHIGDVVAGIKLDRGIGSGDIVTFRSPESGDLLVKRVVAVAGQTVDYRDGYLYVDGVKQDQPYINGQSFAPSSLELPYAVPEGTVWVMGDNRENSKDSRFFGPVRLQNIDCKVTTRVFPLDKIGALS